MNLKAFSFFYSILAKLYQRLSNFFSNLFFEKFEKQNPSKNSIFFSKKPRSSVYCVLHGCVVWWDCCVVGVLRCGWRVELVCRVGVRVG
jgi:hypothetical protein